MMCFVSSDELSCNALPGHLVGLVMVCQNWFCFHGKEGDLLALQRSTTKKSHPDVFLGANGPSPMFPHAATNMVSFVTLLHIAYWALPRNYGVVYEARVLMHTMCLLMTCIREKEEWEIDD